MTNEPKPCRKGDDDQLALELERLAEILARDGCTKWCVDTARAGSQRIAQIGIASTRPSPAPTVSVEECLSKIDKAETMVSKLCSGEAKWTMRVPAEPERDPDLVIGDALHAAKLLVSRLTGAATRSETIEACAKVCDAVEAECRAILADPKHKPWPSEDRVASWISQTDHIRHRIRSLASHPASVAGEARPSASAILAAIASVPGMNAAMHDAIEWEVKRLYERGAK